MAERVAKKSDWRNVAMPERCTTLELNTVFSAEQMKRISKGILPDEMEDKWFMYYDEDESKLYMHRSWTGYCVYIVKFQEHDGGGCVAVSTVVNRDPDQYGGFDEMDKESVIEIINVLFFGLY